jgi:hypothetical protein
MRPLTWTICPQMWVLDFIELLPRRLIAFRTKTNALHDRAMQPWKPKYFSHGGKRRLRGSYRANKRTAGHLVYRTTSI